jgi:plastocyanin
VRSVILAAAVVACAAAALPFDIAGGARSTCAGATVKVTDHMKFEINRYALDAMRFAPGVLTVKSGCTLTFAFATPGQDEGHSLSIVEPSDLPKTTAQMENCKVCGHIAAGHVEHPGHPLGPTNPVVHWVVNVGSPGLDAPGDSIVISPKSHKSVVIPVSAPAGTVLHFICGLHPWMQGRIVVK